MLLKTRSIQLEVLEDRTLLNASPELFADINQVLSGTSSFAKDLVHINGTTYFTAFDGVHGRELWKTDGTELGTVMVKDIRTGLAAGNPTSLTNVDGKLFFVADDGIHGKELWTSDGTDQGTVIVKDIYSHASFAAASSGPSGLTAIGDQLFFSAQNGQTGRELWKSDGTEQGTTLVKNITPGSASSNLSRLTNVDDTLFFVANGNLWKSDGTEAGTVNVANIDGEIGRTAAVGDSLFFTVNNNLTWQLWKSDGTNVGTELLKEIQPFNVKSIPGPMTAVGNTLFFATHDGVNGKELWKSDGTTAGTELVKDIFPGDKGSYPHSFIEFEGSLFFSALDDQDERELWTSDGTAAGTQMVADIYGGSDGGHPLQLTVVDDVFYFSARDGVNGRELWQSDGTAVGTQLVADIFAGGSSRPHNLIDAGGTVMFVADDGIHGQELWQSDGTANGTNLVKDIIQREGSAAVNNVKKVGDTVFFTANDGIHGSELWKTDGTVAGTMLVKDINPRISSNGFALSSYPINLINVGGTLFFQANDGTRGKELWKSDGTEAGTLLIADLNLGNTGEEPSNLTSVNGTLFFKAGKYGFELWKSDGTQVGTHVVKDFEAPGHSSFSEPNSLTSLNGSLFFSAGDGLHSAVGRELWKSDGTPEGTTMVKDINPGSRASNPINFINVDGTLFFSAMTEDGGRELWKSDGTAEGTVLVKDIDPGRRGSNPESMFNLNGTLFFAADDGVHGRELWRSDGTAAGTVLVKDLKPGDRSGISFDSRFANVNGVLYFTADDGKVGVELWKSDGTTDGTVLLKDVFPGTPKSSISGMTNAAGTLFFAANDGVHGRELWMSDGTTAGTRIVDDLWPGIDGSLPGSLVYINDKLLFAGSNTEESGELFGLDVAPFIKGTDGDDTIHIKVTNSFEVTVNGQTQFVPAGELIIDGLGGSDQVIVEGTPGNDTLFATPTSFEFRGAGFRLIGNGVEHLQVLAKGGKDTATLMDSSGEERVVAKPNVTSVRNLAGTFSHRAFGFEEVILRSTGIQTGDFDLANFYDSPASDTLVASATRAEIFGLRYRVRTEGYERNVGRSNRGGDDVALFNGREYGSETFIAEVTNNSALNKGTYYYGSPSSAVSFNRAIGFGRVRANSNGGDDKAFLYDGKGRDVLFANGRFARLRGLNYQFTANQFHRVTVEAINGGNDQATLVDGSGNDKLFGRGDVAAMVGESKSFINSTRGFEQVTGSATQGGTDRLNLAKNIAFQFFEEGSWEL